MRGQTLKKVKEKALKLLRFKAFSWQREKDSNPHKQSQSLSCYPYTIPLNANAIIAESRVLSSSKSKLNQKNSGAFNNTAGRFVNMTGENDAADAGQGIYACAASNDRARIKDAVAAHLDVVAEYRAELFASGLDVFTSDFDNYKGLVALDV